MEIIIILIIIIIIIIIKKNNNNNKKNNNDEVYSDVEIKNIHDISKTGKSIITIA